ncbi:MAG: hypothetical protein Q9187_005797 [Circinaria calcarea]
MDRDLGSENNTPSRRSRGRPRQNVQEDTIVCGSIEPSEPQSATPKSKGKLLFATPTKPLTNGFTPLRIQNADRSARRKSARTLIERTLAGGLSDNEDLEKEDDLANKIRDEDDSETDTEESQDEAQEIPDADVALLETPSKRGPGRPARARRKRSPTPPQNLPPHEQYFFQNRPGNSKTSSNSISSLSLLSHSSYHSAISTYSDPHTSSISFLHSLHSRSFPQWVFELSQRFSICLYGYGSKRALVTSFADYLHSKYPTSAPPTTVIINGYIPTLTVRQLLTTIISVLPQEASLPSKLPSQPSDLLDLILSHLNDQPPESPIYVLINSLDAPSLRRPNTQHLLAALSVHSSIRLVITCDTPSFPLLWDITLRECFNWVFHDTTTFVPYDDGKGTGEVGGVVDSVNELMGRKGASGKGREGVRWVLKSLPENARGLYRILIAEILASADEGGENEDAANDDDEPDEARNTRGRRGNGDESSGVDYRVLYQKAVEEFLCSSEMAFRTLLKEFHDHQMVVSRRDGVGGEVLGVPLRREEMEGVLEDLLG